MEKEDTPCSEGVNSIILERESVEIDHEKKVVSVVESLEKLSKNTKKFNIVMKNYKSIMDNLNNTKDDILKLETVHHKFVTNAEHKLRFHEYGIYIDDIYYQIKLLKLEYKCQEEIQNQNINKLYKDLFRLYNKIVQKVLSIKFENKQNNYNSTTSKEIKQKLFLERKPYYQKIKIYNEVTDNQINIDDCINLYTELESRLSDFLNSIQEIANSIMMAEEQKMDGLLLQTYLISLNSEKEKFLIEHEVFQKLLKGILANHMDVSNKYLERTINISKDIINDTEKIKSL